jgi:hypothetical protein
MANDIDLNIAPYPCKGAGRHRTLKDIRLKQGGQEAAATNAGLILTSTADGIRVKTNVREEREE